LRRSLDRCDDVLAMILLLLLLAGLLLGGASSSSSGVATSVGSDRGAGSAGGVTVVEVSSGWEPVLRSRLGLEPLRPLGCKRRDEEPDLALQRDAAGGVIETVRAAMVPFSGDVWFDNCDRGRLKVGVAPASPEELEPRLSAARAALARAGVADRTDFVAVDRSFRELRTAQGVLNRKLASHFSRGLISTGIESDKNAVAIDGWRKMPARDRVSLMQAVGDAGVRVVVRWTRTKPIARVATN
jgi:hypothetical protein